MPRQYQQLFAICKRHGLDYKDKVAEFTNGRTESLKSLTDGEYKELMTRLSKLNHSARQNFIPKPGDAQRKKIISIAREMRWDQNINFADLMQRIDNYMLTRTKYKKKLMELSEDELNKVLYIFETEVKRSFLKDLNNV